MISAETNMILAMNELSSASDKMITSSESQSAWYIIMINAEANMILAMNESFSAFDEMIISLKSQNIWLLLLLLLFLLFFNCDICSLRLWHQPS